jgi:hypothetical protein
LFDDIGKEGKEGLVLVGCKFGPRLIGEVGSSFFDRISASIDSLCLGEKTHDRRG